MTSWVWSAMQALFIGRLGTVVLCQSIDAAAQEPVEQRPAQVQPRAVEPGTTDQTGELSLAWRGSYRMRCRQAYPFKQAGR
jgi:hypothetical protein